MREENGFIHADPVRIVDGEPALMFRVGNETVILRGSACRNYFAGWAADFLYTALAPILVIQLVHTSGQRVVWYVSSDGHRLGDTVAGLSDHHRLLLKDAAATLLCGLLSTLIQAPRPRLSSAARGFLALDDQCKQDLVALCEPRIARPVQLISVSTMPETYVVSPGGEAPPLLLKRQHLLSGLQRNLQQQIREDVRVGSIGFTCPLTGAAITCQGSLCFDDFHFAYRFTDAGERLVFYVIAGHERSYFYALYVPAAGILIAAPGLEGPAEGARQFLPSWLPRHLSRHGAAFETYLARPLTGITSPLRALPWTHLGHQLWNELSGIEHFLAGGDDAVQPEWLVPDGNGPVEFYGAIEALFPAARGHVRRGLRDAEDLVRYAYRCGRVIVRITRDHVSATMRGLILEHARRAAPDTAGLGVLDAHRHDPVLLLGLRLENRTLVDLGGFYARLVAALLGRFGGMRFVVDGHNVGAAGSTKFRSHGEQAHQAQETARAELALLQALQRRFGEHVVVGAVGLSMAENLRLIARCDAFIAPWGAGLAKYRWVCNLPGTVMTSRWNLEHRADRRIYDDPAFMEAPAEMRWIRPDLVSDETAPPRVVGASLHPQWCNFTVDEMAVIEEIAAFVSAVVGGPLTSPSSPPAMISR